MTNLKKLFSSDKKQPAVQVEERQPSPPPSYAPDRDSVDPEHNLPPPDITLGFSNLKISPDNSSDLPVRNEAIAHLKLLEAFYSLQQSVCKIDGLFGIHDRVVTSKQLADDEAARLLSRLGEKRWAIFVARAIDRFELWTQARFPSSGRPNIRDIKHLAQSGELWSKTCITETPPHQKRFEPLTVNDLPPLDVLLVWHSFMLNPRMYMEDCMRKGMMHLWHQALPLEAIADAIDSKTFEYKPNDASVARFIGITDRLWDSVMDDTQKTITCPACNKLNCVRWTDIDESKATASGVGSTEDKINDMLSSGRGYCDQGFFSYCSDCGAKITAEYLCLGKLCNDLKLQQDSQVPMPGTLYSLKGIPGFVNGKQDPDFQGMLINVNQFFLCGLGADLQTALRRDSQATVLQVRDAIETRLKDRPYLQYVRRSEPLHSPRTERIAIRRLMSRYWNNASNFPLDLVGAVLRQGSFVEKMHNINWLHSPALHSTMDRLIIKYSRFLGLIATHNRMAVPTLDVDLGWHTHQLKPRSYMYFTITKVGNFVDHDDKIAETALNDAFLWTSQQYQREYSEPYSECTCWYCEAVREAHTSSASRFFNTNNARATERLHESPQTVKDNIHISSHNAVRPSDHNYNIVAASQAYNIDVAYKSACNRARKKGRTPPKKDDYYYSTAYGYPVYLPMYSPFMAPVIMTPCMYPINPGCMAVTSGAAGNCCSGTCGNGTTSSVACGSSFSCGGGSSGGCGSSSSGSSGCGGGSSSGGGGGCGGGGSSC